MTPTQRNTRTNWLLNLTILAIALGLLLFVSCSPQKRLSRLVKKHPELVKTDTAYVWDSVLIEGTRIDTMYQSRLDTLVIERNNLTIKHYYDRANDRHYLSGECRDTVHHYTKEVIRQGYTITERSMPFWGWALFVFLGVVILVLGIRR
jgi:hypothetical protein